MDIRDLRNLNLAGTVVFGILGIVSPMLNLSIFGLMLHMMVSTDGNNGFALLCFSILFCWVALVNFLTYMLYKDTVRGLDRGDYETAKRWTLYGAILGFIFGGIGGFGLITLIIFLISFIFFDDALRPKLYYYPPSPYYYPYPPPQQYGPYPPPQQYGPYTPPQQYGPYRPPSQPPAVKGSTCPKCGQYVDASWTTCRYCNEKLR